MLHLVDAADGIGSILVLQVVDMTSPIPKHHAILAVYIPALTDIPALIGLLTL